MRPLPGRVAYGLLLVLLSYVAVLLAAGAGLEARAVLLRYGMLFGAGLSAVAVPHVLLPDSRLQVLQHLNLPPPALLVHQLRQWIPVVVLLALPCILLAFYDPGRWGQHMGVKGLRVLESLLVVGGIGLYSFGRYVVIGQRSQAWQEGKRGGLFRRLQDHGPLQPLGVPDGLVPAITATGAVFLVGALTVVAGAYLDHLASPAWAWLPGLVLLSGAAARLLRLRAVYDRHFYATNAFYGEVFRSTGGVRVSGRAPVPYEAVYWVPPRWKPHVWASLRQLDRKLPLGRLILLGHLFLWVLFYQDAGARVIAGYLLLFSTLKNGVVYLLTTDAFAPGPFQVARQSAASWALTRFFVNLRWTMPLLLSLLLVAFFDPGFSYLAALAWTGLDLVLALLAAGFVTWAAEGRYRKRYA